VPYKRFVEIGEGTHSVLLEKNRMQLFREVQLFLDDPSPYSLTRLKGESKVLAD
jgi:hypothetical protein